MQRRALISVSDKTGIIPLAQALVNAGIEIISTGGTNQVLQEAGISTIGIEDVTSFPEMMDGRVKTLHPLIHGALLGRRDVKSHKEAMQAHGIVPIDYVVVNLYPFKETILKEGVTQEEAIENIDIGGPSMLRSAAKNHDWVTVVVDPQDYTKIMAEIDTEGHTRLETRQYLAAKVFRHTAAYDAIIANYLTDSVGDKSTETLTLTYDLKQSLRYGENSHQQAMFYQDAKPQSYSIAAADQLYGKELSYNNIRDADAAIRMLREFDQPAVVAVKHMNPCGIGTGEKIEQAFLAAYEADPVSIFGGIIALNRPVDQPTAQAMSKLFLEIIIAPSFDQDALELLKKKKNLRLLTLDFQDAREGGLEVVSVLGGLLVQDQDALTLDATHWQVVTKRQPTDQEYDALRFAWRVVKHVKSNAIVLANDRQTVGIGAGQMNRVGSVRIAANQAQVSGKIEGAVLASDAFFPMADSIELAHQYGLQAIIQPGGSVKDEEVIAMADKFGMTMIFTNVRHFKH